MYSLYYSRGYIQQWDQWIIKRCLRSQSLSCSVVLLQSLERQTTASWNVWYKEENIHVNIFRRNISNKYADQMTTTTTVSWIYLKTVEMLFIPSRADQVPQTFRFLRLYNYINHICQMMVKEVKNNCHFINIISIYLTNEKYICSVHLSLLYGGEIFNNLGEGARLRRSCQNGGREI